MHISIFTIIGLLAGMALAIIAFKFVPGAKERAKQQRSFSGFILAFWLVQIILPATAFKTVLSGLLLILGFVCFFRNRGKERPMNGR